MKERDWLATDLASAARVPLTSVTRLLDGTVKSPGIDTVVSLAKALDLPVSDLLGERAETSTDTHSQSVPRFVLELFEKWVEADASAEMPYITLLVAAPDEIGLLSDITGRFAKVGVNIVNSFSGRSRKGRGQVIINASVDDQGKVFRIGEVLRSKYPETKVLYPLSSRSWMEELAAFLADDPNPASPRPASNGAAR
jgi:transcriptional regulator with XRE-family HTH domain